MILPEQCKKLELFIKLTTWSVLFLFVFLITINLTTATPEGHQVDDSWVLYLNYAHDNQLQAGKDYVFTYGPLGYRMQGNYTGWSVPTTIFLEVFLKSWVALVALLFSLRLPLIWRVAFVFMTITSPLLYNPTLDAVTLFSLLPCTFLLLNPKRKNTSYLYYATCLSLGVLTNYKFTLLVLCSLVICGVSTAYFFQGNRGRALKGTTTFLASALITWTILGQHITNIPSYLLHSYEIASGYGKAMIIYESRLSLLLALLILLIVFISFVALIISKTKKGNNPGINFWTYVVTSSALLFIAWKIGYVRSGGHSFAFLGFAPILIIANVTQIQSIVRFNWLNYALFGMTIILSYEACHIINGNFIKSIPQSVIHRIKNNVDILSHPRAYKSRLESNLQNRIEKAQYPKAASLVGDSSVDVWGQRVGLAIYNQLNVRSRPIFQSYSAYTSHLMKLNQAFYQSGNAPSMILYEQLTKRFPPAEDSQAFLAMASCYNFTAVSEPFYLLSRNKNSAQLRYLLSETHVQWGSSIEFEKDDRPLIVSFEIHTTLFGKLVSLLYKLPKTEIEFITSTGESHRYNFIPSTWRNGVLVNPIVTTREDFQKLKFGQNKQRLAKIFIHPPKRFFLPAFQSKIKMKTEFMDKQALTNTFLLEQAGHNEDQLAFHNKGIPIFNFKSNHPVNTLTEEGKEVLLFFPPGQASLVAPDSSEKIQFDFGILPLAYNDGRKTDGVGFSLDLVDAKGEFRTLWKQVLDPLNSENDRGIQFVSITLPPGKSRKLILRSDEGPGDGSWDFSVIGNFIFK